MESLQAQLATAERLERVIGEADSELRLLNARLDEAAARTIELSVQASSVSDLGGLGDDVDQMVDDMEALRQAIEETSGGSPMAGPG
jgi:phage shock protein A